jgi:hypothetical protein
MIMVDTLKARPNHYETLGLTPSASSEDIAKAFAKEVELLPLRPLGTFSQVSAAYETLRDPVRRMAYDASLSAPPRPNHPLIGRLERTPIDGKPPASAKSAEIPPRPVPAEVLEPAPEPIPAPAAGQSVRQPPKADDLPTPPRQRPEPPEQQFLDQVDWHELERQERAERSIRPDVGGLIMNTAVGGALLLAIVLGAWTGLEAGNDNLQGQQVTADLPISLSPAAEKETLPTPASRPSMEPANAERAKEPAQTAARVEPARAPLQIDLPREAAAKPAASEKPQILETPSGDFTAEPAAPPVRSAKLPLPDAVVARTIAGIGYACGQVASTSPMEGEAPGTFKVTCTSGDSYRAAPRQGRYHFRRLGSR